MNCCIFDRPFSKSLEFYAATMEGGVWVNAFKMRSGN